MTIKNSLRGYKKRAKGQYVVTVRRGKCFLISKKNPRLKCRHK